MLTHIRLDAKMDEAIDTVLAHTYFKNKSEFVRDAIRKSLEEYEVHTKLKKLQGSGMGFVPTREQRKRSFLAFEQKIKETQESR